MRAVTKFLLPLIGLFAASFAWRFYLTPRTWPVAEVPIAFWSWRVQAPTENEVQRAVRKTRAQTLFLRAGQIDSENHQPRRIRAMTGQFPRGLELHLVYNATRSLLADFEQMNEETLAALLVKTYELDTARARSDGATVTGLQLDFDIPTRLLPRYERLLRKVREVLPPGTKLSITGLPTWMDSSALNQTLTAVDFWIPQLYGAVIPDRLSQSLPISSPQTLARTIARVRHLDHPFYAGLSAYGYAILYAPSGALIELRGDLDPAHIAHDSNFELIERRAFASSQSDSRNHHAPIASEWRYVYRARADGVVDGLAVRADDRLMLDVPSAEALRAGVRVVREEAGVMLLGICVFRLPSADDPTTLTLGEVAAALTDTSSAMAMDVTLTRNAEAQDHTGRLLLTATNTGTASALMGNEALQIELHVPAGSVRGMASSNHFTSFETLCALPGDELSPVPRELRPCSPRRANVVRLKARDWMPGAKAQAALNIADFASSSLSVIITASIDDGRVWRDQREIAIRKGGSYDQ